MWISNLDLLRALNIKNQAPVATFEAINCVTCVRHLKVFASLSPRELHLGKLEKLVRKRRRFSRPSNSKSYAEEDTSARSGFPWNGNWNFETKKKKNQRSNVKNFHLAEQIWLYAKKNLRLAWKNQF